MKVRVKTILYLCSVVWCLGAATVSAQTAAVVLTGRVSADETEVVPSAIVRLKEIRRHVATDAHGHYRLNVPEGHYTLQVSAIGYATMEQKISLSKGTKTVDVKLHPLQDQLGEVIVSADATDRVNQSAYNAVAISTTPLKHTAKNLSDALAAVPGVKLRQSGGEGSDMALALDGYTGKHVKVFIDGVPQEGVGEAFGLNNIPVGYAERIEVYKGVVPVGLGSDALGGAINIVRGRKPEGWRTDLAYTYGSFNTHKTRLGLDWTAPTGWFVGLNFFQNYSDNDYRVDTPVEHFNADGTTVLDTSVKERVRRFNDTYHNETVEVEAGLVNRSWADRLLIGGGYAHMYKEIQTGVVQKVVFGRKHRHGHTFMLRPEYAKRDFVTSGLDLTLKAGYNHNVTQNVDTSSVRYNWLGEGKYQNGTLGEQSYQDNRLTSDNWNAVLTLKYRLGRAHSLVFNHVFNTLRRSVTPTAGTATSQADAFDKLTRKNVGGLSYAFMPAEKCSFSVFGKYYNQHNEGPVSTSAGGSTDYVLLTNSTHALGYGLAASYAFWTDLQAKCSFERAYRLPTNDELFGDEDLELGSMTLKPEKSHNLNFSLCYNHRWTKASLFVEATLVYRNTADYIQRRIGTYTGNKAYASYQNHGKVLTKGYTLTARYVLGGWLSVGGNLSHLNARDNVKTLNAGSQQTNLTYGTRLPNLPYLYAGTDMALTWSNIDRRGGKLSLTYDNLYQHSFPLYAENLGSKDSKEMVPEQFAHNLTAAYNFAGGRFSLAVECRNLTNAKLYDNYSLQKPGRAFYATVRVAFGQDRTARHKSHKP